MEQSGKLCKKIRWALLEKCTAAPRQRTQVDASEREFGEKVGIAHTVALSIGTAAMHLALCVLNIEPGDEVIASTLTFISSAPQ